MCTCYRRYSHMIKNHIEWHSDSVESLMMLYSILDSSKSQKEYFQSKNNYGCFITTLGKWIEHRSSKTQHVTK